MKGRRNRHQVLLKDEPEHEMNFGFMLKCMAAALSVAVVVMTAALAISAQMAAATATGLVAVSMFTPIAPIVFFALIVAALTIPLFFCRPTRYDDRCDNYPHGHDRLPIFIPPPSIYSGNGYFNERVFHRGNGCGNRGPVVVVQSSSFATEGSNYHRHP